MTQVSEDADFGTYHEQVVGLLNTMSGLAPEELARLADQFYTYCDSEVCAALQRVREATNKTNWSLVKLTLNSLMKLYCAEDRYPVSVTRDTLDFAQGAAYFALLAVMGQDLIRPEDFDMLTKPCREADIKQMSALLERKTKQVLMTA